MKPNEAAFEEYVTTWLVEHGGYDHLKGPGQARPPAFDPVTGIDSEDLFEFIGATQADAGSASSNSTADYPALSRSSSPAWQRRSTSGAHSTCCATA